MLEYIALGSAALVMYLFITGRVYAMLRCVCLKCGRRTGFVINAKERWSSYDFMECIKCGSKEIVTNSGSCSLRKDKGGAGFQASLWPLWMLPVIILKLGRKNGYKSIERGLDENVRPS